jgi:hypothetical protein
MPFSVPVSKILVKVFSEEIIFCNILCYFCLHLIMDANSNGLMIDFWCFNATFSNISAISWRPVLVVEEAGENHRPWASNW